jgi:hypothetical protein
MKEWKWSALIAIGMWSMVLLAAIWAYGPLHIVFHKPNPILVKVAIAFLIWMGAVFALVMSLRAITEAE